MDRGANNKQARSRKAIPNQRTYRRESGADQALRWRWPPSDGTRPMTFFPPTAQGYFGLPAQPDSSTLNIRHILLGCHEFVAFLDYFFE